MSLTGPRLQRLACTTAQGLPGVTEGYPFTEHLLVFKVAGRVFLVVTQDPGEPIITVKVDPAHGAALIGEHDTIERGRYFDKRHWVSVGAGESVTASLAERLVHNSYELVTEQLPASQRTLLRQSIEDLKQTGIRSAGAADSQRKEDSDDERS